jgi:DNA-binding NarL/FixJ family response regulator
MTTRLVLADDHPLVLEGLKAAIKGDSNLFVVTTAIDGELLVEAVLRFKPDLAVIDQDMPFLSGVACVQTLRNHNSTTRTLILADAADERMIRTAMEVGTDGLALKTDSIESTLAAIHQVAMGNMVFPSLARKVFLRPAWLDEGLTEREIEILKLVSDGLSNVQIATAIKLTENTVKFHLRNLFAKLGVSNRTEAAAKFHRSN